MVKTGYISFITETGGGFDANGNPISATKSASVFYPCNIATITKEYRTLVDGQYLEGRYSCYIDNKYIPRNISSIKEVQIQDNRKNSLGNFQIQNIEYLELMRSIKLIA